MKKYLRYVSAGLIASGALLMVAAPAAAGNVSWGVSIGMPAPVVYAAPPVMYSAPAVYGPPAVYYPPAPVVYVSGGPAYRHGNYYRSGGPAYRHGNYYHQGRQWRQPHERYNRHH